MSRCYHRGQHISGEWWTDFGCPQCFREQEQRLDAQYEWDAMTPEERIEETKKWADAMDKRAAQESKRRRKDRLMQHFIRLGLQNKFQGKELALEIAFRTIDLCAKRNEKCSKQSLSS